MPALAAEHGELIPEMAAELKAARSLPQSAIDAMGKAGITAHALAFDVDGTLNVVHVAPIVFGFDSRFEFARTSGIRCRRSRRTPSCGSCATSTAAPPTSWRGAPDATASPHGSASDSITLGIAHHERGERTGDDDQPSGRVVLDRVEEVQPPFSPDDVAGQFAAVLRSYGIGTVQADKWGAEWVAEPFRRRGITVEATAEPKSAIYLKLVPLLNSGQVALLDHDRLRSQLVALERKAGLTGRDIVDHPRGGHDDVINAAAGALVAAMPGEDDSLWVWAALGRQDAVDRSIAFYGGRY